MAAKQRESTGTVRFCEYLGATELVVKNSLQPQIFYDIVSTHCAGQVIAAASGEIPQVRKVRAS